MQRVRSGGGAQAAEAVGGEKGGTQPGHQPRQAGWFSTRAPKPATPAAIRSASDSAQTRHTANTCWRSSPWRRTKAFWAPMATIRLSPRRNPGRRRELGSTQRRSAGGRHRLRQGILAGRRGRRRRGDLGDLQQQAVLQGDRLQAAGRAGGGSRRPGRSRRPPVRGLGEAGRSRAPVSRPPSRPGRAPGGISVIWLKICTRSPRCGRIVERELDAAHGVLDVDEGPRLAAGPVHGQRIADRRLHQEAVQHRAVVAVVVEAVDQPLVEPGLLGLRAPDDALVQVGDPQAVVLGVELEQQRVQGLGQVVDAAGIGRVEDLLLDRAAVAASPSAPVR